MLRQNNGCHSSEEMDRRSKDMHVGSLCSLGDSAFTGDFFVLSIKLLA